MASRSGGVEPCRVAHAAASSRHSYPCLFLPLPDAANGPTLTLPTREQARTTERAVPVVSLKVAAGAFSAAQSLPDEVDHWVQLPEGLAAAPGLFVAQVIGESMSRRIPNGAWCLFRAAPTGSRQNKILLVQHRDVTDPETGGSYTVKRYQSEMQGDGEGWRRERITLMQMSSEMVGAVAPACSVG